VLRGLHRVERKQSDVVGIAHERHADAVSLGLLDGAFHRGVTRHLPKTVATVDMTQSTLVAHGCHHGGNIQHTGSDPGGDLGQEVHAVRVDPARVRLNKIARHQPSFIRGRAGGDKKCRGDVLGVARVC